MILRIRPSPRVKVKYATKVRPLLKDKRRTMTVRWRSIQLLSHTPQLAPSSLQATHGLFPSSITDRSSTATGDRTAAREHAIEGIGRGVRSVGMDLVSGTAATNVVDGGNATQFTFEFFVEAKHGAFTAAVDVASTTTAGLEGLGDIGVQTGERRRTCRVVRIGGLGVLQVDDIASTSASCMDCGTASMGDGRMRFDNMVICRSRHDELTISIIIIIGLISRLIPLYLGYALESHESLFIVVEEEVDGSVPFRVCCSS